MKKSIFTFVSLLVFILCSCSQQYKPQYKTVEDTLAIEQFVDTFLKTHPKMMNNNITKEEGNKAFKKALEDTLAHQDLLQGIPVELITINKSKDGKYLAQFRAHVPPTSFNYFPPIYRVYVDLLGVVSEDKAKSLKEDVYYQVDTKFISFIENISVFEVVLGNSTMVYTDKIELEESDMIDKQMNNLVEVSLGMIYVDYKSISGFKGRNKTKILINPLPKESKTK